jgi:ATP-dependent exoDNAse (exonuclease V) beta subunit
VDTDKRVIFAVAGSGKTTHIVEGLSENKRSLIVTHTNANLDNLHRKISIKFDEKWPENIVLTSYFSFIYNFCYKPFLSDKVKSRGIVFDQNIIAKEQAQRKVNATRDAFYMTNSRYFYSNRISYYLSSHCLDDIKCRINKYFDEFIIDEVQDVAGRDFKFLEHLMEIDMPMLFVGDFYQHTYDTSRDGNTNKNLFNDKNTYEERFESKGFKIDNTTLTHSWRCSKSVCEYVTQNLGIEIASHRHDTDDTIITYITGDDEVDSILNDPTIIKLHYWNASKYGRGHRNWGDTKGEDNHGDVCIMLNAETATKRENDKLSNIAPSTKNKLYVAITRARGNVYLIDETKGVAAASKQRNKKLKR